MGAYLKPPFMVLSSKLEVCQCHSYEISSNYQEDYKDNKQDAVYSINPVTPDTGKYIVKFNVYSTERQKASHCHLWNHSPVPWPRRNLSGILSGVARSLEFSLAILPSNPRQHQQRWCYKWPYNNCAKWESSSGIISNCYGIQKAENKKQSSQKRHPINNKIMDKTEFAKESLTIYIVSEIRLWTISTKLGCPAVNLLTEPEFERTRIYLHFEAA